VYGIRVAVPAQDWIVPASEIRVAVVARACIVIIAIDLRDYGPTGSTSTHNTRFAYGAAVAIVAERIASFVHFVVTIIVESIACFSCSWMNGRLKVVAVSAQGRIPPRLAAGSYRRKRSEPIAVVVVVPGDRALACRRRETAAVTEIGSSLAAPNNHLTS